MNNLDVLARINSGSLFAEEELQTKTVLPVPTVPYEFSFIGIQCAVGVCIIYRFEPVHAFLLGLSEMLRKCSYSCLSEQGQVSNATQYLLTQLKPFVVVQKPILQSLNSFFVKAETHQLQFRFCLDFLKDEKENRIAGPFTKYEILGMPEVNDYNNIDYVSLFFGEIIDVCCGSCSDAPVTDVSKKYVDLLHSAKK